jgi:ADP-ribose pyrophosphatase
MKFLPDKKWEISYSNFFWTSLSDFTNSPLGWHCLVPTNGLDGVAVLVQDSSEKVLLNIMKRHTFKGSALEIPRGGIEPGETPPEAASRELLEETGVIFSSSSLISLGCFRPDSGILSHQIHLFYAKLSYELNQNSLKKDHEVFGHSIIPESQVYKMIKNGKISDPNLIICLFKKNLISSPP